MCHKHHVIPSASQQCRIQPEQLCITISQYSHAVPVKYRTLSGSKQPRGSSASGDMTTICSQRNMQNNQMAISKTTTVWQWISRLVGSISPMENHSKHHVSLQYAAYALIHPAATQYVLSYDRPGSDHTPFHVGRSPGRALHAEPAARHLHQCTSQRLPRRHPNPLHGVPEAHRTVG